MKTINRYLLVSLALALVVAAAALAVASYFLFERQSREQELSRQQVMIENRARVLNETFLQALRRLELARDDALARLDGQRKEDSPIRLGHDTVVREDGSLRSREDRFDPKWEPGIFAPAGLELDEDLKHRIVTFRDTANLFGQAWRKDYSNIWFAGPEGWLVAYWPVYPWTEKLAAGHKLAGEAWFAGAAPAKNPGKGPVWGMARVDPSGKTSSVTLSLPLYVGDSFIGVIAEDVPLLRMAEAMVLDETGSEAGLTRLVFGTDGSIIAMSGRTDDIAASGGSLKADDNKKGAVPSAASAIAAIQAHGETLGRVHDAVGGQYAVYATLGKLPWTLAVLVPNARIKGGAPGSALLVGGIALFCGLLILVFIARQVRVSILVPLRQLTAAVASITHGHADVVLPTGARGEIADLANSLIPMQESVAAQLDAARQEKMALMDQLAAAKEKAESTQRRLDEETIVAEDRANRLKDIEQRYNALMQQSVSMAGENGTEATGDGGDLSDVTMDAFAQDEAATIQAEPEPDGAVALPLEGF